MLLSRDESELVCQVRLFQFKITLRGVTPAIWRRILVFDDTLDNLHEHIQAAMGWTNSHLHHFSIEKWPGGNPELLDDHDEPFSRFEFHAGRHS